MSEDTLNKLAAERCSKAQLEAELQRIDNAIKQVGWKPGDKPNAVCHRYAKRRAIYQAELIKRSDGMAGAGKWYAENRYMGD